MRFTQTSKTKTPAKPNREAERAWLIIMSEPLPMYMSRTVPTQGVLWGARTMCVRHLAHSRCWDPEQQPRQRGRDLLVAQYLLSWASSLSSCRRQEHWVLYAQPESWAGCCGAGRPPENMWVSSVWSKSWEPDVFQGLKFTEGMKSKRGWRNSTQAKPVLVKVSPVTAGVYWHNKGIHGTGRELREDLVMKVITLVPVLLPQSVSSPRETPFQIPFSDSQQTCPPARCPTSTQIMLTTALWMNCYVCLITIQQNKESVGY